MTLRVGTWWVALVIMTLALASCGGHGSAKSKTSMTTPPRLAVTVDTAATPSGWVPFAYEGAQVSVPSTWLVEGSNCGTSTPEQPVIYLGSCSTGESGGCSGPPCGLPIEPDNWIEFSPLPNPPASYRGHPGVVVNGYGVYQVQCDQCVDVYDVPSLGVELLGGGPMFVRVLHTLSSSPRAVALEPGPAPATPSTWPRVSFGGLSIAVPGSWPVEHQSVYDGCSATEVGTGAVAEANTVVLNAGTTGVNPQSETCENPQGFHPLQIAIAPDGLLIDPGGYRPEGTTGNCRMMNGMSVCEVMSDPYAELTLSVEVQGHVYPVAVEIGLGGNGTVARTILFSMHTASSTTVSHPAPSNGFPPASRKTPDPISTSGVTVGDSDVILRPPSRRQ